MKKPMFYADLADLSEDNRISLIGQTVRAGNIVGVCVDDIPSTVERYVRKIEALDGCELLSRSKGPVPGVLLLRVGPKASALS